MSLEIKKSRLAFLYFCILAAFFLVIGRMVFVVAIGDKVKVSGIYDPHKNGKRGSIFDRNGVLVATDLKTKSLYVSSVLVRNPKLVAKSLSRIFPDLSYKYILKKIISGRNNKYWILIRRNLTPSQVVMVNNLKMAGLIFEDDQARVYPQKSIISHYVGYVDLDRKGLAGMERAHDKKLAQGDDLYLAMDIRLQDILHDELFNAMKEFKVKAAGGVVMDVNNGEILALSSLPEFDPNLQSYATSRQRFNRVVNGVYELGSVFKIFTNAIAFDHNLVKISDKFEVKDPIKYGRFLIKDDHKAGDILNVGEIFSNSSNIGTVKIAEKIGVKRQKDFFKKSRLLQKLDINFPGAGKPIYSKRWRDINLYTISYGHGIAVTPLHLANGVSSVVNGGFLVNPTFVKSNNHKKGVRIVKESTSQRILSMLRDVVINGTGKKADIDGYEVGGKTGTAERAESGSYNKKQTMASFVAVFPISKPKYLIYVFFDRPNSLFNTGGMVAAPVAGRIIKNIAPLLGVRPNYLNKN